MFPLATASFFSSDKNMANDACDARLACPIGFVFESSLATPLGGNTPPHPESNWIRLEDGVSKRRRPDELPAELIPNPAAREVEATAANLVHFPKAVAVRRRKSLLQADSSGDASCN